MATLTEVSTVNTSQHWTATGAVYASGSGLYVLAGVRAPVDVAGCQTSPDLTTWTMHNWPSTATRRAVAYTPTLGTVGRVVAVGNGVADWSDDGGVTWNAATSLPEANSWWDVKWWDAQAVFIACAISGTHRVMTSADGKSWTNQTAASALAWSGIAVSDTVAVCIAFSSVAGTQFIQTSGDGATWALQTHANVTTNRGIVANGQRLGIGYSPDLDMFLVTFTDTGVTKAYRSVDDGVTWTASNAIPTISNTTNRGYVWVDTAQQWYMACANFNYQLSSDGVTWANTAFPGTISNSGYTPMGWDGRSVLFGGSTLGFDTALLVSFSSVTAMTPSRGTSAGGTVVTIAGAGLSGVVQGDVLIDGVAALSVSAAADGLSVTCVTPAHAVGLVDVVVTGIGTLTGAYTFVSVTKVTPNTGTTFGGTAVTITGFGFDLATGVTFDGVTATSIVYVSNTTITAVTPTHNSGAVNVAVAGVGTLTEGYTYAVQLRPLPPIPYTSKYVDPKTGILDATTARSLNVWKERIENPILSASSRVPSENIIGTLQPDQIPELPWDRISKVDSSLADLAAPGVGANGSVVTWSGGTPVNRQLSGGAPIPFAFDPGSLTVPHDTFVIFPDYMHLAAGEGIEMDSGSEMAILPGPSTGAGTVVQVVTTQTGAVATGATVIPIDDTIPQNTEGDQFMSLSITPTNAEHRLRIDVVLFACSNASNWITTALFQDSTAGALAAFANYQTIAGGAANAVFSHTMRAGTTSSTTFKVRAGRDAAAGTTVTFNGSGGGRLLGGALASSITITEIVS